MARRKTPSPTISPAVDTILDEQLHSVPEARALLGNISHSLFYALVRRSELKVTRLGGRTMVTHGEIRRVARGS